MPLTEPAAARAPSGWDLPDLLSLSNLTDMHYTPGAGHTVVEGTIAGRTYRSYVTVLTVGRMAPLAIPEQKMPWQLLGDQLGLPLEWSSGSPCTPQKRHSARYRSSATRSRRSTGTTPSSTTKPHPMS